MNEFNLNEEAGVWYEKSNDVDIVFATESLSQDEIPVLDPLEKELKPEFDVIDSIKELKSEITELRKKVEELCQHV